MSLMLLTLTASLTTYAMAPVNLPWMNAPSSGATYSTNAHPEGVFVVETFQLRCGYCNDNMPHVDSLARFYSYEPRVQVLNLGIDRNARDYEQWIARHNPSFPVLMDARREVWTALQGSGTPTTYVLDCNLAVKWRHVGVWDAPTRREIRQVIDRQLAQGCRRP